MKPTECFDFAKNLFTIKNLTSHCSLIFGNESKGTQYSVQPNQPDCGNCTRFAVKSIGLFFKLIPSLHTSTSIDKSSSSLSLPLDRSLRGVGGWYANDVFRDKSIGASCSTATPPMLGEHCRRSPPIGVRGVGGQRSSLKGTRGGGQEVKAGVLG